MKSIRKTITYSAEIITILKQLNDKDRLTAYDLLNSYFIFGQPIKINELSENLKLALVCITPQMRKLISQFSNGKAEKKFKNNNQGNIMPKQISESLPNETKLSSNNFNNTNNNINNKYNLLYQTDNSENILKLYSESLKLISAYDNKTLERLQILLAQLIKTPVIKINGLPINVSDILICFNNFFKQSDSFKKIKFFFENIDSTENIKDAFKYTIAALYNFSKKQVESFKTKSNNQELENFHQYDSKFLNSLFNTL